MKKLTVLALLVFVAGSTFAQTWSLDKAHSKLGFNITHMMLAEVEGGFKSVDATITSSKEDLSDAVITLTADVNSITTENEQRDNHLKSPDFFDAAKFPTLSFKSTSFKKDGDKKYKVTGDLTLHGVTKPVTLDVTIKGPVTVPMGQDKKVTKLGLKVTGVINRVQFGIGQPGGAMLSEEVTLDANGEFNKN
jgi:polyisoprenoid-binding protein YceI